MTFRGTVKGNVVVLETGAHLPDGVQVQVETQASSVNSTLTGETDPFQMGDLAAETGIPDLATNANHYLYGHPKISHAG
jgi:hypothetical protein